MTFSTPCPTPVPPACPGCGVEGALKKLVSAGSGLIFKGSGFYITDYKKKETDSSLAQEGAKPKNSEGKDKAKAKTETKAKSNDTKTVPAKKD